MRMAGTRIVGDLSITTQTFSEVGDVLKVHSHSISRLAHRTIVAKGSVRLLGSREGEVLNEGDMVDWALNELHGFVAVVVPATVYNIRVAQISEKEWPLKEVGTRNLPSSESKTTGEDNAN